MARISKRIQTSEGKQDTTQISGMAERHYKAGVYARLSSNQDTKKNESVETQIDIAKKYVEEWNEKHTDKICITECYTDLGKTGTNFEREAFKRLMQDIRLGEINCVIVKDLSRFGRTYLEAGNYIEKIFPFLGVRFIAVADGYDTEANGNETKQMASQIKNLVNDLYAKDFSMKAKQSLKTRREEGAYVGGPPPYGYRACWEDRMRKLCPDDNTAQIVRYIFQRFVETESYAVVANDLNTRRINPPSLYKTSGEVYCPSSSAYHGWDKESVERILKSETYVGNLIQGKTSITAKNEKNRVHKDENEWVKSENRHEPLIDRKLYEQAAIVRYHIREKMKNKNNPTKGCPIEENIFDQVLYCGVCGRKMTRHSYVKDYADGRRERKDGYFCLNGGSTKTDCCPLSNRISKAELLDIIFAQFEAEFAVHLKKQKYYTDKGRTLIQQKKQDLEMNDRLLEKQAARLVEEEAEKYEKYRMGIIEQKEYVSFRMKKENLMKEIQKKKVHQMEAKKTLELRGETYLKAVRALVKLKSRKEMTKDMVETLIEKIYVYPGKRIEVLFAYGDPYLESEEWKHG